MRMFVVMLLFLFGGLFTFLVWIYKLATKSLIAAPSNDRRKRSCFGTDTCLKRCLFAKKQRKATTPSQMEVTLVVEDVELRT